MNRLPHPAYRILAIAVCGFTLPCFPALAQHDAPAAQNAASACVAVESDPARLACYDRAFSRDAQRPALADDQAQPGQEMAEDTAPATTDGSLRRWASELFRHDPTGETDAANAVKGSLLDSRWELARDSKLGVFQMRGYKPVYLMPVFWTSDANELPSSPNPDTTVTTRLALDDVETKLQLSFKTKFVENLFGDNGDLWGGYTQNSRWQVYNSENSRPFRETNYEPEVMLVFRNNYSLGGWKGRMTGISINHQSNGRADPLSRSWNRLILSAGLDRGNWAFVVRPWWRIPDGTDEDDNPDIEDYIGRGDAMLVYSNGGHEFAVLGRHSLRGGEDSHGAVQLDWGFPIDSNLRGHVQLFHGYGESLIDYNHKATYLGLGVSLLEWF